MSSSGSSPYTSAPPTFCLFKSNMVISGLSLNIIQVTTLSPTFKGFPALSAFTFLPIFTISPVPSWPKATGMSPKGSLLNSWASVPQMPQPSTFTRISPSPTSGIGNSFTSYFSNAVSIATLAVFGTEPPDVFPDAWLIPLAAPPFIMLSSTCFTTASTSIVFILLIIYLISALPSVS